MDLGYSCRRVQSDMKEEETLHESLIRCTSDSQIPIIDVKKVLSLDLEISPRDEKEETIIEKEVNCEDILSRLNSLTMKYYVIENRSFIGPSLDQWEECYPNNVVKNVVIGKEINGELVSEKGILKVEERNCRPVETVDVIGVCLASIKGLSNKMDDIDKRITRLEEKIL